MKKSNMIKLGCVIVGVIALVALYFLTPLNEYLKIDKVVELTKDIPESPTTVLIFLAVFFAGGALLIPVPLMAFAVSLVFNIWLSVIICIFGFACACLSGYGIGRIIGADVFGESMKKHIDKIKQKMDDKGAWAVMALRLAPTPPFTVTSIISGSLEINFGKYVLGSTLGIMPLGLSAVFFGRGALEMIKQPSGLAVSSLVAAVILYIVFYVIKKKRVKEPKESS